MEFLERTIHRYQTKWESEFRTPLALYKSTCESLTRYMHLVGGERFRADYTRKNLRFVKLYAMLTLYLLLSVWCMFILWGQLVKVIFCFVTTGFAIQGFAKMTSFTDAAIYEIHTDNIRFIETVNGDNAEVRSSLMRTTTIFKMVERVLYYGYGVALLGVALTTIAISLAMNRFELPFGFFFPWFDRETLFGYGINMAFHTLLLHHAFYGLLGTELCFFCLTLLAIGRLDVMVRYLRKLSELADAGEGRERLTEIDGLLRDLIELHNEHIRYLTKVDKVLRTCVFVTFGGLIAESATALYVLVTEDEIWYNGILIVSLAMVQLFIPCCMGSMMLSKNDQLIREAYNVSWTRLPIPAQKALKLFLRMAQDPVVLSDGFSSLDLFSFVSICKKIYTYLAVLQEFK